MDADDIAFPDRLMQQLIFFQNNPKLVVLGGSIEYIDSEGKKIGEKKFPIAQKEVASAMHLGWPIAQPTVMFRRQPILSLKGYREQFTYAEDYDLWLRCYAEGYIISNLDKTLIQYRINEHSISHKIDALTTKQLLPILAYISFCIKKEGREDFIEETQTLTPDILEKLTEEWRQKSCEILHEQLINAFYDENALATFSQKTKKIEESYPSRISSIVKSRVRFKAGLRMLQKRWFILGLRMWGLAFVGKPSFLFLVAKKLLQRTFRVR